jgi:hypothetical protein
MGMGRELARSVYWELSTALLVKYADIVRFPVSLKNRLAYLKERSPRGKGASSRRGEWSDTH